jgi:hypothetical protein
MKFVNFRFKCWYYFCFFLIITLNYIYRLVFLDWNKHQVNLRKVLYLIHYRCINVYFEKTSTVLYKTSIHVLDGYQSRVKINTILINIRLLNVQYMSWNDSIFLGFTWFKSIWKRMNLQMKNHLLYSFFSCVGNKC